MTKPPPRTHFPHLLVKWHLSTAIVMMFVAGERIVLLLATTFRWWLDAFTIFFSRLQPA